MKKPVERDENVSESIGAVTAAETETGETSFESSASAKPVR